MNSLSVIKFVRIMCVVSYANWYVDGFLLHLGGGIYYINMNEVILIVFIDNQLR